MTARLLAAAAACTLVLLLASCNKNDNVYQGWIEADLIFVAPEEVGRLQTLSVREGDTVKIADPLFTVDDELQQADLAQVKASLTNAQQTYDRAAVLLKTGSGTQMVFDAAQAALRDAQARLNSSQTKLARRSVFSPVNGAVQEVYYRPGEMVPADRPVLALLPPRNIKVRFFVSETALPNIAYGDRIKIGCDGCASDLSARVSFIAKQSEFTPPVIYSREERAKLVFLIEALPEKPGSLRVGQPVDVTVPPQPPAQTPSPEASR
ncbi:MAG: efflux RND transporter periplasmic adaptor subunit [Xanthobacteraceae bacterium]|jgi:HlyD family secretion protein